ncbi:hypothetical protein LJR225_005138 [Phenylobacterium sp. LjRoot225]|uniref:hypothetical protein n=1 Tax=Phenylobacterium sp. LjRoot225 TaxID=3342285 RepID=UPI003ED139B6
MRRNYVDELRAKLQRCARRVLAARNAARRPDSYTWFDWGLTCWGAAIFGYVSRMSAAALIDIKQGPDLAFLTAFASSALAFAWPLRHRSSAPFTAAANVARKLLKAAALCFVAGAAAVALLLAPGHLSAAGGIAFNVLSTALNLSAQIVLFALVIPCWLNALRKVAGPA